MTRFAGGWTLQRLTDEPAVVVRTLREAREWIFDHDSAATSRT